MNLDELLVLGLYACTLGVLCAYGTHRFFIVELVRRYGDRGPPRFHHDRVPFVTVQLPVFNERHVVCRLIDAACALSWPRDRFEVQVLDDSTDDTTSIAEAAAAKWRRQGVQITVIHRTDRRGFKAGALAAGTAIAQGEFLAVFDADFVHPREFLLHLMPYFDPAGETEPRVGMVQARWGHLNERCSLLSRLQAQLLDGHFVLEHTARNRSGRFFNFNGTAGIWRRCCIHDAGGWEHDTLTEDLDLSYRAQMKGWRFAYLPDVVAPAELPGDMRAFKAQQYRWAKGTLQTARKLLIPLLTAKLPWGVRIEAAVHLTSNLTYPLVLLMALLLPIAVAVRGSGLRTELLLFDLAALTMATASLLWFYTTANKTIHGSRAAHLWRVPLVLGVGMGIAVNQTRAVIEGIFGHDVTFERTPKRGAAPSTRATSYRLPFGWTPVVELAIATYYIASIGWALQQGYWASVPTMIVIGSGFLYVGLTSAWPDLPFWRRFDTLWKSLEGLRHIQPIGTLRGRPVRSIDPKLT